ncbi:MAG: CoA transferase [Bdellovibrionales bacterium]|jgi:CoA:oxalate CoA-transferase|nr:CoA transferase [Bdellovibrionales bacterium]MBT3524808.1 CoA transferase [Bdellovibrionales bacterium]MBT7768175.1 CoA transferase [Bdellovibrionales bacterium]
MNPEVFSGIRVLDFTQVIAGSYATTILGDMGAEIIKVEPPVHGDTLRFAGPMFKGESGFFLLNNRNKKSISVNLKSDKGVALIKELIPHCDIVTQNFKPGVMEKLGLSYQEVKKIKQDIIYVSVSGYGQNNKNSHRPAYDNIIQCETGLASLNGHPGSGPLRNPLSISDYTAGMYSAFSMAAALIHRQKSGEGQFVDVAMFDTLVSIMDNSFLMCDFFAQELNGISDKESKEQRMIEMGLLHSGNRHPGAAPHGFYKTKDGSIAHMSLTGGMWNKLLTIIGRPELVDDPKYQQLDDRKRLWREIDQMVEEWTIKRTTSEVMEIFEANKLPVGEAKRVDQVFNSEHVKEREIFHTVEHPTAGAISVTNIPIKFSKTPTKIKNPSPLLGEHNLSVLSELLGHDQEMVESLLDKKVLYQRERGRKGKNNV